MKKRISDLRSERTSLIEEMKGLLDSDQAKWDEKNTRVAEIDKELEKLERQDALNSSLTEKPAVEKEVKQAQKRYDLFKAIREASTGKLTGLELEMFQEAEKEFRTAGQTVTEGALVVPSLIYKRATTDVTVTANPSIVKSELGNMSIVAAPVLLQMLGVTIYNDLVGKLVLPYNSAFVATFPGEGAAVDGYNVTDGALTLEAKRVGGTGSFTKELLAQTSQQVQDRTLQDFFDAIWRAVQKKLFTVIAADANIIHSDYEAADATVFPSLTLINALFGSVIDNTAPNMGLLTTNAIRGYMMSNVGVENSGIPMWQGNLINGNVLGLPAFTHSDMTSAGMIIGNWKNAAIGQWAGLELIVDPYTSKKTGKIEITANGLFDAGCANPDSFSVARNLKVA
jgi:HK97 family phage major capsid protein